ncbi:MAG: serine/threonine protein kinase [Marinibacterium sp.]
MTENTLTDPLEKAAAVGDELPPGTQLCHGQYTIVKYLNSGGFGITYLALDSLGRKIVIKECFPGAMCRRRGEAVGLRSQSYETDFVRVVELFEKEAGALAQLQHANIVGVHQIFKDNRTAYMALDFVEGTDLLQVLEDSPEKLDPATLRRMLVLILDALAYVHSNGILHRDISPDNILMDSDGMPVLIDFGAARENATRASRVLSRVHTVKDGYSPQEFYLAGSSQEKSSDLYALAATMHHLITGVAPPNSNMRLAAVAQNEPDPYVPLFGRVPEYDEYFLKAIDQCLSVFAKDRLESAQAWYDFIDEDRRKQEQIDRARQDEAIEARISQFVAETARQAEPGSAKPAVDHVIASPTPAQNAAEQRKQEKDREYWAILNEAPERPVTRPKTEPVRKPERKRQKRRLSIWGLFRVGRDGNVDKPYRG